MNLIHVYQSSIKMICFATGNAEHRTLMFPWLVRRTAFQQFLDHSMNWAEDTKMRATCGSSARSCCNVHTFQACIPSKHAYLLDIHTVQVCIPSNVHTSRVRIPPEHVYLSRNHSSVRFSTSRIIHFSVAAKGSLINSLMVPVFAAR